MILWRQKALTAYCLAPSDRLLYTAVVDTWAIGQIKGRSRLLTEVKTIV